MNFKRLKTFVQVADCRCFSDVAEIMNMTQSGISRQIKALEEELSVQLLNRKAANVELTPAGRLVYKKAIFLLAQWEQLQQECLSLKQELNGVLKIGASTIPGTYLLPRIIKTFQSKYPKVEFSIRIEDSSDILDALKNKQIDIAMVGVKPVQAYLQVQRIAEDRLVLIGKSMDYQTITLNDVKKIPFIVREKGSGTREAMDKSLRQSGIDPDELQYAAEVNSTESIMAMIEAGVGIACISNWTVQESARKNIAVLFELPTDRCFYIASHISQHTHPLIQTFTQETMQIYA